MSDAPILKVKNVQAFYGSIPALHDVSFTVAKGGITAVLGANGAGKTTILRAISGLIRVAGVITYEGKSLVGRRSDKIAAGGIAHVPDGRGTFGSMTVEENLLLGAYTRRNKKEIAADLALIYERFPVLKERRLQTAATMSGGEQQILAISRALMLKPRLMLLDEPSFGVAPLVVKNIFNILRTINKDLGVSMLLVEQNAEVALEIAKNAFLLETGRVIVSGTVDALLADDKIRHSYLGY